MVKPIMIIRGRVSAEELVARFEKHTEDWTVLMFFKDIDEYEVEIVTEQTQIEKNKLCTA